jgi:F0F1-type ATP synthase membrane subunit c/vacuolar-type H+-ATPase subunit K
MFGLVWPPRRKSFGRVMTFGIDPQKARRIITLAAPIVIAMFTQTFINVVDTMFVGKLDPSYSIPGQAALGFSLPILWAIGGFLAAIGVGTQAMTARRIGAESPEAAGLVLSNGVVLAVFSSIVLTLFGWWIIPDFFRFLTSNESVVALGIPYARLRILGVLALVTTTAYKGFFDGIGSTRVHMYAAIVMNYILGGSGFGSRLMEEVREKRGLSYGIYTYLGHMDSINTLQLSTSTQNENVAQTLGIIAEEWQKMSDAPITEKELQDAQAYLVGSLPLSLTSTDKISGLLLNMQMDKLPISYLDDRSAKIEAVTTEDVSAVSQNLLNLDNAVTILVGKPSAINEDVVIKKDIPNAE